jgi:hypothetical protein
MATGHLSIRLDLGTIERLDAESKRSGRTRSELARTLIEEGLRMERHPGIVFRSGPSGRRPGLAGGPDVWEVIRVFREVSSGEQRVEDTASLTGLSPSQVMAAARYYAEFADEINAWISRIDEEAASAESLWRREQTLLQR